MVGSQLYLKGSLLVMRLSTPHELKLQLPINQEQHTHITCQRTILKKILTGEDPRIALVIGPCSIHNPTATIEYALRLKALAKVVASTCYIVMRAYFEKPRTITGWKGFLYDPYLDGTNDIEQGIFLSRQLLLTLTDLKIPIATEFLDPIASHYLKDLITWGFIGARTCTSSIHRQLASSLDMPIGFKNSTSGNIEDAINGILAARTPHSFIDLDAHAIPYARQSKGNSFCHIVLRGSDTHPNFDEPVVKAATEKLIQSNLPSRILIDCSHGNSNKNQDKQPEVFHNVLDQVVAGNTRIMGLMLESFLQSGCQPLAEDPEAIQPGISITDPCLDWQSTQELVLSAHAKLSCAASALVY